MRRPLAYNWCLSLEPICRQVALMQVAAIQRGKERKRWRERASVLLQGTASRHVDAACLKGCEALSFGDSEAALFAHVALVARSSCRHFCFQ